MLHRIAVLSLPVGFVVLLGCKGQPPPSNLAKNPPVVQVSRPVLKEVTDYEIFTGRMEASKSVEIRARVNGYLKSLHFVDGEEVKKDQLLFEIDPRPFKAALNQAEANLRQAEAHLKRL